MASRKRFNHVAAGLLHSFVSRCNDVGGYWALGVLYRAAQNDPKTVELDLLGETAAPACPACVAVARHYAAFLRDAAARQGIAMESLSGAGVVVEFDTSSDKAIYQRGAGDLFRCTVTIAASTGTLASVHAYGHCLPYHPQAMIQRNASAIYLSPQLLPPA